MDSTTVWSVYVIPHYRWICVSNSFINNLANCKEMRTIKAYWESKEFDSKATEYVGCMKPVKHYAQFEVEDNATDEEIEVIARRKDIIPIKSY